MDGGSCAFHGPMLFPMLGAVSAAVGRGRGRGCGCGDGGGGGHGGSDGGGGEDMEYVEWRPG